MVLDGLATLHRSMRAQDLGRCKFRYNVNQLAFDCLFFADIAPYELVMGCIGHQFVLFFDVQRGYQIKPFLDDRDTFFALRSALMTEGDSDFKLSIKDFMTEFNQQIPATANPANTITNQDIADYYPSIEDAHKVYFCGWRDNNTRGTNVSPDNLRKTQLMLGQRAFDFAKRRNQSTCWTHEQNRAIAPHIPD